MDYRVDRRYFLILSAIVITMMIISNVHIRSISLTDPDTLKQLQIFINIAGIILIVIFGISFFVFHLRIGKPLNHLVTILKQHIAGDENPIVPLHVPNDIGPLLYSIEILLKSLSMQIQESDSEHDTLVSVINRITDGIVIINDEGDISSLNPAAESMFNITAENAQGHTVAEVLRHHQWIELYRSCQDTNTESSNTLEIPANNIFLQGIAVPLGESLPGYILMVFQDLSEIRRLETTRQDFLSNISHELRTPLASLKALTDTLLESALDDPTASRRFLGRMDTEVDALSQMVSELLELSRIESGKVPLDVRPVMPSRLLHDAYERLRAQAERKKIEVNIKDSQQLPEILADPRRIEQVLVNLLHNAIKFSEQGGEIILDGKTNGDFVTFSVKDFGSGISENDLVRIFERFYKTDQARSGGGTGLGLSIAKHIVEAHQGEIWAESILNEGSKFSFSLPIQVLEKENQ
jgi:two-component system phosphate regulon sensor histidine kinase PhoR